MKNTSNIRLLPLFLLLTLFSVKYGLAMDEAALPEIPGIGEEATTEVNSESGAIPEIPATQEETTEAPVEEGTDVTAEGGTATVTSEVGTAAGTTAVAKGPVSSHKGVKPAGKVRKPATKAQKKGVIKKSAPTKKARVTKSRGIAKKGAALSEIEKIAAFSEDGNIESFNGAIDKLIEFSNGKTSLSPEERMNFYSATNRIYQILGSKGFATDDHYDAAVRLFNAITEDKKLSKLMLSNVVKWTVKAENKEPATPKTTRVTVQKPKSDLQSRRPAGALPVGKGTPPARLR